MRAMMSMMMVMVLAAGVAWGQAPAKDQDAAGVMRQKKAELFKKAWIAASQQRYEDAAKLANQLLELDPNDVSALMLKGEAEKGVQNKGERVIHTLPDGTRVAFWAEAASVAWAQAPAKDERAAKVQQALEQKVILDFEDTPIQDVVTFVAEISKVNMLLDFHAVPPEGRPITMKVKDMPLKAVLDFVSKQAGLKYAVRSGVVFISNDEGLAWNPVKAPSAEPTGKLKEALARPVTLDFADTPMGDVATFVSDFAGVSIVADKSAEKAQVTVKVKDIPLKDALELTVIQARLKCQISGDKLLILR